jgi:hypothetical protein
MNTLDTRNALSAQLRGALLLALALAFVLPAIGVAQATKYHPASDPAAVALYERHNKATGVDDPPRYQHSIIETRIPNGPAMRVEMFTAKPNRILMRNFMDSVLVLEMGYDGEKGWSSSPQLGVAPITGAQLEAMLAGVNASATPGVDTSTRLVLLPRRTFEDQLVEVVLATTAEGDSAEAFFSVASGLMVGAASRMRAGGVPGMPAGMPTMSSVSFRDYRLIAGRQVSHTMVTRMGDMEVVARTTHLDFEPIPDERFRAPAPRR